MAVEVDRLELRQEGEFAVQVAPARLDHADAGIGEMVDRIADDARVGNEIRVEHEEKLARRGSQPFLESAGLEAGAMAAR